MIRRSVRVAMICFAAALCVPTMAHHSTNGIYNEHELVELTGRVIEWRFVNPHPSLLLEVTAADGSLQEWDVSYGGAAVTHLRRRGYSPDTFAPGDVITVSGFAALVDSAFGLLVRGDPTTEDGAAIVPVR